MVYGGFEQKFEFIRPVIDRIAFIHGRIGNPGCMQVDLGDGDVDKQPYVCHFRSLWTESFRGFLRRKSAPRKSTIDRFVFAPELLGPRFYYARVFDSREESDRWQQSLLLTRIARECFEEAVKG